MVQNLHATQQTKLCHQLWSRTLRLIALVAEVASSQVERSYTETIRSLYFNHTLKLL